MWPRRPPGTALWGFPFGGKHMLLLSVVSESGPATTALRAAAEADPVRRSSQETVGTVTKSMMPFPERRASAFSSAGGLGHGAWTKTWT
jgi:hypothetical protein